MGLGVTATKYIAENRSLDADIVGRLVGLVQLIGLGSYFAIGAALFFSSGFLATNLLNNSGLEGALKIAAVLLFFQGLDYIQIGILAGFESFKRKATVNFIRAIINIPITLISAKYLGLHGVIMSMILLAVITIILNRIVLKDLYNSMKLKVQYSWNFDLFKMIIKFAFPAFVSACFVIPCNWIVNAVLVNQPDGYQQMGILNAATNWRSFAVLIPTIFNSVFLSIQTHLFSNNNLSDYQRGAKGNLLIQTFAGVTVAVMMILGSPYIMKSYGPSFEGHEQVLIWLTLSWVFITPQWIFWNLLLSSGRIWTGVIFNFIGAALLIVLSLKYVNKGSQGIAMAYFYAYAIQAALQFFYFCCYTNQNGPSQKKTNIKQVS